MIALRDDYERLFKEILGEGRTLAGWRVPDLAVVSSGIATMCSQVAIWYRESGRLSAEDVAQTSPSWRCRAWRRSRPARSRGCDPCRPVVPARWSRRGR